jgi:hypothetical protein
MFLLENCGILIIRLHLFRYFNYGRIPIKGSEFVSFVMDVGNGGFCIEISQRPDKCPFCNTSIVPEQHLARLQINKDQTKTMVNVFYGCTKCANSFCVTYSIGNAVSGIKPKTYYVSPKYTTPPYQTNTKIDERINQVSQRAVDLFHEAEKADNTGLTEIAGMGYRKSLECLIKDALVKLGTKTHEEVVELNLNQAIELFDGNSRLTRVAHQARVIGNDFTHYEAKYEGYDITTLKKLLGLAFSWLSDEFETKETEELQKKNQPAT